jgi:thymidylate kinase
MKYIYMGISTLSSNISLPTSRLILALKLRAYRRANTDAGKQASQAASSRDIDYHPTKPGTLWAAARSLNRFAEAWYRHFVALSYRLRGYAIVYDRHLLFETAPGVVGSQVQKQPLADRLLHWLLRSTFPKPELVVFLDAPAEVLYKRKQDVEPNRLERRRGAVLEVAREMENFVQVDASQPLDQVIADVTQHIMEFYAVRSNHSANTWKSDKYRKE